MHETRRRRCGALPRNAQDAKNLDKYGTVAASIQFGQSPPIDITGVVKDGDTRVLTTTRFEDGRAIWRSLRSHWTATQ
jgi:hypothetical protein